MVYIQSTQPYWKVTVTGKKEDVTYFFASLGLVEKSVETTWSKSKKKPIRVNLRSGLEVAWMNPDSTSEVWVFAEYYGGIEVRSESTHF